MLQYIKHNITCSSSIKYLKHSLFLIFIVIIQYNKDKVRNVKVYLYFFYRTRVTRFRHTFSYNCHNTLNVAMHKSSGHSILFSNFGTFVLEENENYLDEFAIRIYKNLNFFRLKLLKCILCSLFFEN